MYTVKLNIKLYYKNEKGFFKKKNIWKEKFIKIKLQFKLILILKDLEMRSP